MLISHRKSFIFTKTAKTAGTSTEVYFEPYCMPEGTWQFNHARAAYVGATGIIGYRGIDATKQEWYNHMSAELIQQKIGKEQWAAYYKFCTVRNPYTKLISAFHFFEQANPELAVHSYPKKTIPQGIMIELPQILKTRFRSWVRHSGFPEDRDKYTINGQICIDYFIKQEELAHGIQQVCATLKIPFQLEKIPQIKTDSRPKQFQLSDYYDAATIALVAERFAFEFESFGYSPLDFPSPSP